MWEGDDGLGQVVVVVLQVTGWFGGKRVVWWYLTEVKDGLGSKGWVDWASYLFGLGWANVWIGLVFWFSLI